MSLLLGVQPKGLQRNIGLIRSKCGLCTLCVYEDGAHVLFECNALEEVRLREWPRVLSIMPGGMASSIRADGSGNAYGLIVSCLVGNYISEWNEIYRAILDFIYHMYTERAKLYDSGNFIS